MHQKWWLKIQGKISHTLYLVPLPTPCAILICCFPSLLFVQRVNNVSAKAIWRRHWEQFYPLWGYTIYTRVGSAIGFVPHRGTNFHRHYLYSIMPRRPVHCNIRASHRRVVIWRCVVGYILSDVSKVCISFIFRPSSLCTNPIQYT